MRSKLAGEGGTQSSFPEAGLSPGPTLGTESPGVCRKVLDTWGIDRGRGRYPFCSTL